MAWYWIIYIAIAIIFFGMSLNKAIEKDKMTTAVVISVFWPIVFLLAIGIALSKDDNDEKSNQQNGKS